MRASDACAALRAGTTHGVVPTNCYVHRTIALFAGRAPGGASDAFRYHAWRGTCGNHATRRATPCVAALRSGVMNAWNTSPATSKRWSVDRNVVDAGFGCLCRAARGYHAWRGTYELLRAQDDRAVRRALARRGFGYMAQRRTVRGLTHPARPASCATFGRRTMRTRNGHLRRLISSILERSSHHNGADAPSSCIDIEIHRNTSFLPISLRFPEGHGARTESRSSYETCSVQTCLVGRVANTTPSSGEICPPSVSYGF